MAYDSIASRYAQALFETVMNEGPVDETLESLDQIGDLIRQSLELQELLFNPGVDSEEKVGILERILKHSWSPTLRAFIRMVVELGRAEFLPQIVEAFQAMVDAAKGRLRVLVRSARPLSDDVLARLRAVLERRERKRIELAAEVAPEIIGGLQVYLDHQVIDGSVRQQVNELRERLMAARIH